MLPVSVAGAIGRGSNELAGASRRSSRKEKGSPLQPTVSVILAVERLPSHFQQRVVSWLELLGEWTARFELVIVDCGTDDAIGDVALSLAASFPQVAYLSRAGAIDFVEAVEAGIAKSGGRIVFVDDGQTAWNVSAMELLWAQRDDPQLVSARAPAPSNGVHMLRRAAIAAASSARQSSCAAPTDRFVRTDVSRAAADPSGVPNVAVRRRRMTEQETDASGYRGG